jgi:hypothetical protein
MPISLETRPSSWDNFVNIRSQSGHRREDAVKDWPTFQSELRTDNFDDAKRMIGA